MACEQVERLVESADVFMQVQYVTAERIVSKVTPPSRAPHHLFVTACVAGAAERGYTVPQAFASVHRHWAQGVSLPPCVVLP